MHFYNLIKQISEGQKLILYVDMDGVIAEYDIAKIDLDFVNARPLLTNIKTLKMISELPNIELHILSVCRLDSQIKDKHDWLDKFANFFDFDKRVIISRESNNQTLTKDLKLNYLKTLNKDEKIALIDDDNEILKTVKKNLENIILFQDSQLID